jgi:methylmalonyl-CoA mutase C-terminal domain/subunit
MGTIRIIIAQPGPDGHDRGAMVMAGALRDAGIEVIYAGLHQTRGRLSLRRCRRTPTASGCPSCPVRMTQFSRVLQLLAAHSARDIAVFGGGIVPEEDIGDLAQAGVARIFTAGARMADIVDWVRGNVGDSPAATAAAGAESEAGRLMNSAFES